MNMYKTQINFEDKLFQLLVISSVTPLLTCVHGSSVVFLLLHNWHKTR